MFKELFYNMTWVLPSYPHYQSLIRATNNIEKTQNKILLGIIKKNKKTMYGKKHSFDKIDGINDFQKLPITEYEDYIKYIDLIQNGESNILTEDGVTLLMPTSGSTKKKLIPYTKGLKKEFQKAIFAWTFDLFRSNKKLFLGKLFFSISPELNQNKSIGFEDDTEYFGWRKHLLNRLMVVPNEVKQIKNTDTFHYVTLLFLLKEKNLRFISIWSPTYLTIMLDKIPSWIESIAKDIRDGTISKTKGIDKKILKILVSNIKKDKNRAIEVERGQLFDSLEVISCWGDGNSSFYLEQLKRLIGKNIQEKGLISTEAFISLPIQNKKILAINSHFFEFIDIKTNKIYLAHNLKKGEEYYVVITTSGGLYRYNTQDIVRCDGYFNNCPELSFIGRNNYIDLFGEKISESFASEVCKNIFKKHNIHPSFFMISPELINNNYFYALFIDYHVDNHINKGITLDFEKELSKNYHYAYCRKLGQLTPARVYFISKGKEIYMEVSKLYGIKMGNLKNNVLNKRLNWSIYFDPNMSHKPEVNSNIRVSSLSPQPKCIG